MILAARPSDGPWCIARPVSPNSKPASPRDRKERQRVRGILEAASAGTLAACCDRPTKGPHPHDPAVGKDRDSEVASGQHIRPCAYSPDLEAMLAAWTQLGARQYWPPLEGGTAVREGAVLSVPRQAGLDQAALRKVASEVIRVNDQRLNRARRTEAKHAPITSRVAN